MEQGRVVLIEDAEGYVENVRGADARLQSSFAHRTVVFSSNRLHIQPGLLCFRLAQTDAVVICVSAPSMMSQVARDRTLPTQNKILGISFLQLRMARKRKTK